MGAKLNVILKGDKIPQVIHKIRGESAENVSPNTKGFLRMYTPRKWWERASVENFLSLYCLYVFTVSYKFLNLFYSLFAIEKYKK